jgi:hypothetical protein
VAVVVVVGRLGFAPAPGAAHDRSRSHVDVRLDRDGARIALRLSALDVNALAAELGEAGLDAHLRRELAVLSAAVERPCAAVPGTFRALRAPAGAARWEWGVRCDGPPARLRLGALVPSASHLAFVTVRDGERVERLVLSRRAPEGRLAGRPESSTFASMVVEGTTHVLGGLDHLVFLVLLLLAARTRREVVTVITGFTIGHGATLLLAGAGTIDADVAVVEATIALSIALVAIENVWHVKRSPPPSAPPSPTARAHVHLPVAAVALCGVCAVASGRVAFLGVGLFAACWLALGARRRRCPAAVAALFGLVHGLGFASALGSPDSLVALLGFNAGVEVGQLAVAAVAWPGLAAARRGWGDGRVVALGSTGAMAAAAFWLVDRL